MANRKRMTEDEIAKAVSAQIDDAKSYYGSDRKSHREWALKFFEGEVDIPPMGKHRSSVVSRDVADTHGLILPGLLRIFFSSSRIVTYEATRPEHEEYADLASDLVNYVVMQECNGYGEFRSAFADGLLLGNGIVKHWWDDTPEYKTENYTGLTDERRRLVLEEPDVEVTEEKEYDDPDFVLPGDDELLRMAGAGGLPPESVDLDVLRSMLPPPPKLYDFTIKRLKSNGRLCVRALPPEEFRIERSATALDEDVLFCEHVQRKTRSELVKAGFSRAKVDKIPRAEDAGKTLERDARDDEYMPAEVAPDTATEQVDFHECYILLDADGDGIAERLKIVMAGHPGKRAMLSNNEWGDRLPFSDLVPEPVPHRWRGRSLYDEMGDIQRVNTVLLRGVLDNTYKVLAPQRMVWENSVLNPDELMEPTYDGTIWMKSTATQVPQDVQTNYIVPNILPVMEYMNQVGEKRTGVSMRTQALDLDALQNQSATAVHAAQSAAQSKVEEYARNIAECGGMRRIFGCCLRLIAKHQDRAKIIRLKGRLVEIDPRAWDADMDVTINTGLGTGSRERDLTILSGIAGKQEAIIAQTGPLNPFVNAKMLLSTYQKMAEAGGIRNPESFFPTITDEQLQAYQQQTQAQQQNGPASAKAADLQQKLQLEQQKAAADYQLEMAKLQAEMQAKAQDREAKAALDGQAIQVDIQLRREESAARIAATREENAAKLSLLERETAARIDIERQKVELQHQARLRELQLEAELAAVANAANIAGGRADTNIARPE